MTRLDRFLVNNSWAEQFPKARVRGIPKLSSDHIPLIWENETPIHGRWYFKFKMAGIKNREVNELVKNIWQEVREAGWSGFKISKKVQSVKKELIRWRQNNGVNYKRKIEEILNMIFESDVKEGNSGGIECEDIIPRNNLNRELQRCLMEEEIYGKQRARVRWLIEGDLNTRFIHATTNARKRVNSWLSLISHLPRLA
ncbi:hypothetical protein AMTRI_Chr06g172360 [Amborella trichopoda]